MSPLPQERWYSYADLLAWDEDIRYELYDGLPMAMASPTDVHQEISGELHWQLENYLRGKPCRVYYSPLDVRLFERDGDRPEDVYTVVQPDLMVVCDRGKVDRHGVHGAPDLVIEILSESTRRLDRLIKFDLYQRAGVREYWIVDPVSKSVQVFVLEDGRYSAKDFGSAEEKVRVNVLEDCEIDLSQVFS